MKRYLAAVVSFIVLLAPIASRSETAAACTSQWRWEFSPPLELNSTTGTVYSEGVNTCLGVTTDCEAPNCAATEIFNGVFSGTYSGTCLTATVRTNNDFTFNIVGGTVVFGWWNGDPLLFAGAGTIVSSNFDPCHMSEGLGQMVAYVAHQFS